MRSEGKSQDNSAHPTDQADHHRLALEYLDLPGQITDIYIPALYDIMLPGMSRIICMAYSVAHVSWVGSVL